MDERTVSAPPSRRRRSPWRWVTAIVLVALLGVAFAACSVAKTEPALSKSCQAARSRFVEWSNFTVDSLNSANAAMSHWDNLWNRWVSGQMTMQQQQAARARMHADTARSIAADKRAKAAFAEFTAANSDCSKIPKGCVAEFNAFKLAVRHEAREALAVGKVFSTEAGQVKAWNAQQAGGSKATVDAATARHNAAEKNLHHAMDEHDRVHEAFHTAQVTCDKAIE